MNRAVPSGAALFLYGRQPYEKRMMIGGQPL